MTLVKVMINWKDSVVSSRAPLHRVAAAAAVTMLLLVTLVISNQSETGTTSPQDFSIKEYSSTKQQPQHSKLIQVTANDGNNIRYNNVTEQAALQIQHYKQGTGLIVNIHITHHGGTTVCRAIGHSPNGTAPSRACNRPTENDGDNIPFPERNPWLHAQTADNIKLVREHFHMIGMEFGYIGHVPKPSLAVTDWEHPDLVSMIVMRHPVSRLLARSGWIHNHYPDIPKGNASQTDWWEYAKHPWFTNNYALRVLAGHECCDGANTSREHLQQAKALVRRFSIVLDIQCLDQGLEAVSRLLNISLNQPNTPRKPRQEVSLRDRVGYKDVYEYLLEKNQLDIELYEWSKNLALVDCSKI